MADGAQETVLSWNFTNWITISLMAIIGFTLIGAAQKFYASRHGA